MAPSRAEILERERRWLVPAGVAAVAVPLLMIGSNLISNSVAGLSEPLATEVFRAIDESSSAIVVSSLLQSLSVLLWIPALLLLFMAARARSERVSGAMIGFVFIGPVLYAVATMLSAVGNTAIAQDFVAGAANGGDIYSLLEDLGEDNTVATVGQSLAIPAALGSVVALIYVPLQAMRVGLLTRFFGTLGIALGVGLILIGPIAPILIAIWFGWLGFVLLGRAPRGRPPAWDAGRAIPWPRPGEESSSEPEPARPADFGVVEGEGAEVEPKDHSARRERAKKRKRKRRG